MQLFNSIFTSADSASAISFTQFLLCIAVSLAAGFLLAVMSMWRAETTKSFMITLAVIPAAVCAVIMMVNGNIGTGVAVAGAFALVRFRSAPGTAREIGAIFASMGIGLMTGMGYLAYAVIFAVVIGAVLMAYSVSPFGENKEKKLQKQLKITIPEDMDYCGVFEPVLEKYTSKYQLIQVKSTHMGSLFKLTYNISLKDESKEKEFLDELRVRNGNLEIVICFEAAKKVSEL